MAFEQKEGGGSLFKNDYKTPGDSKPDYKGSALINGVEMDIAAWIKKPEGKKSFFSLSIKPKADRSSAPASSTPTNEDDLPF